MHIEIAEEPASFLTEYARIPISFQVTRLLDVTTPSGPGGEFILTERAADAAFEKDYDAAEENGPLWWRDRFDLSEWGVFSARVTGRVVAGAMVAFRSPDIAMLEGRGDLALLCDIRVAPAMRGNGIGSALMERVEKWTLARQATCLKVETQNINVPACRFYESRGFVLRTANAGAYPDFPEEIQLLWYKDLLG
jgi:GNAT superfamily N-acetyltransferase